MQSRLVVVKQLPRRGRGGPHPRSAGPGRAPAGHGVFRRLALASM